MKLCAIGLGQAGGKILDLFLKRDVNQQANIIEGAVAINTAEQDLYGLEYVPEEQRTLIGKSEVKGNGVGADNELGSKIAKQDITEILSALDHVPIHEIDAFLLLAGLGGGTGSGALPVVANELKKVYSEPVYGLGILPARDEGGIYTLNAARSFQTCVRECDALIAFDNDSWSQSGESLAGGFSHMNEEIVTRLLVLFGAGEFHEDSQVAESVVDASEVINTLNAGGVSTIGYAEDHLSKEELGKNGLLSRFSSNSSSSPDDSSNVNRMASLTRKAALGQLTLPADIESVEKDLLIASGPSKFLSRKGIEKGRLWLEENTETMEVRGGDYPVDSNHVSVLTLLSGVTEVPRIKELQQVAIEAQENIEELSARREEDLEHLVTDEDEDLDSLF